MKRLLSLLIVFFIGIVALYAQNGELSGKIVDEKGEAIPFATVSVEKEGVLTTGAKTDFDGFFTIKPLAAGTYDVRVSNIGYGSYLSKGVRISADRITELPTVKLKVESTTLGTVEIVEYKVPLIDKEDVGTKNTITQDEIKNIPTRNVESIASTSAGVYQEDEGKGLNIRGSREGGTAYYIDGIKVTGSNNIPPQSIEQITVITGGVPAKFGDANGGVINIVTRGPASDYGFSLGGITSQGMDAAGYNDVNFSLTGPIWTKYRGTDSADAKIGFFLSGEYLRQQDPGPSAIGVYKVKDAKLADLEKNPLVKSPVAQAFRLAAEDLRLSDLDHVKSRSNAATNNFNGSAKIDFKVTDNINVTVGATADLNYGHNAVERYDLLNYVNNPQSKSLSYRAFVRFTQRFSKANDKDNAKSSFQNAYYSLQADYSKVYNTTQGAQGFNAFNYGYLGKYDVFKQAIYAYGQDTASKKFGYLLAGYQDTLVKFTPGTLNPTTTNFVTKYFELAGNDTSTYYRNIDQIRSLGGLVNGQRSSEVYSIWFNTGRLYNGYGVNANNDQFRLSLQGAVDIQKPGSTTRNKHSLEFGIEFEQRIQRAYNVTPLGLWDLMRQETNKHLTQLDKSNPILRINGRDYNLNEPHPAFGVTDTIKYNYLYQDTSQSYFDKNLRAKLGKAVNSLDILNVDALDPAMLSLDMFNAEELLNNGSSLVSYYGYDYTGAKLGKNPSFNDFFFQKDDKGNYTRAIGAFKPIYTAGYIQDKFNFKDLLFNVGVRVDRYDANQKVLKDKYSLYKVLSVAEAQQVGLANNVPTSMGSDYAVYVDNNDATGVTKPTAIGYRNGDTWYNADGVEVANASIIARSSGNGGITPYLDRTLVNKIKDPNYDPSSSFQDFKPQINVMPRISFSFNVTDEALFYAHYDILTQRPTDFRSRYNPTDYFYFDQNVGSAINNPNLKPEKTIDYEVGFKQKVATNAAVTFSAFYRELRDNIQVRNIAYAYPRDYLTFDNIDFGTVKGFSFAFDMRRSKALPLSLKLNYSIQFAEGTGSNDASQGNLVQAGQPNLRTVTPLDYDARHTFNVVLDYHFGEGKDYNGPKIKGVGFLENFGANILLRGRSGTPYTAQSNPTPDAKDGVASRPILSGSKNGSRLPWRFNVDFKVDKSFNLTGKKKGDDRPGRSYYANVYILIENLFDIRNVLTVYHYTGNANDDGYLGSPLGQQDIAGQINQASFTELYQLWSNNPANYSLPRQIRIGFDFNF